MRNSVRSESCKLTVFKNRMRKEPHKEMKTFKKEAPVPISPSAWIFFAASESHENQLKTLLLTSH